MLLGFFAVVAAAVAWENPTNDLAAKSSNDDGDGDDSGDDNSDDNDAAAADQE